jgi:uncharacterized membrane protein
MIILTRDIIIILYIGVRNPVSDYTRCAFYFIEKQKPFSQVGKGKGCETTTDQINKVKKMCQLCKLTYTYVFNLNIIFVG